MRFSELRIVRQKKSCPVIYYWQIEGYILVLISQSQQNLAPRE